MIVIIKGQQQHKQNNTKNITAESRWQQHK